MSSDGMITSVDLLGHADYADEGSDIVCAAITSTVQLTHALLNDVQQLDPEVLIEDDGAHIRITLRKATIEAGQDAMRALRIFYTELASQYSEFLNVMEVQYDA